jgi:hypothetical protein
MVHYWNACGCHLGVDADGDENSILQIGREASRGIKMKKPS